MSPRNSLLVAVAALVSACAPAARQEVGDGPVRSPAMLAVQNNNWQEVAVYLVRGTQRTRLGTVPSMRQGEFRIPDAYVVGVSEVTVQADPIGARDSYVSPPIQVFPGARVALKVEQQLRLSNFGVYASH